MHIDRGNPFNIFQELAKLSLPKSVMKLIKFYCDRLENVIAARALFPFCTFERIDLAKFLVMRLKAVTCDTTIVNVASDPPIVSEGPKLNYPRVHHISIRLLNGDILVCGGTDGSKGAELYSSERGIWELVGSLSSQRNRGHKGYLIQENRVLIAGGRWDVTALKTCEIYEVQTKKFSFAPSLPFATSDHVLVMLERGKTVLCAGGVNGNKILSNAALFDVEKSTWKEAAPMSIARKMASVKLLSPYKAVVAGGYCGTALRSLDVYDLVTDTWTLYEKGFMDPAYKKLVSDELKN